MIVPSPPPPIAPPSRGAAIVNVGLFVGALSLLGLGLGLRALVGPSQPEVANDENRVLASAPTLTRATVLDGSFALGVDAWISDHFPARDPFMATHFWLEAHRGHRAEDAVAFYAVEIDNDAELEPLDGEIMAELELEPLGEGLVPDPNTDSDGDGDGDGDGDTDTDAEDMLAIDDRGEPSSIVKTAGILVADGRAMQLFAGSPRGSRRYARALNRYAGALPAQTKLYSLIVPTAQTFYLPNSYIDRVRHEPPNIAATYAMMDPSVVTIDVVAALREHANEYIYFRTDHHWTGLGAYYAYVGFCQAAGLQPVDLQTLARGTIAGFRGSLYRYTRDQKLRGQPDEVEYWIPSGEITVQRGARGRAKAGALIRAESSGYGVFLGGDQPLLIARSEAHTGRRALLIKNSYGNPFAVFLAAHFDTLVVVDYRKFDGSVLDLVEEYDITDVIVLNGAITSNAEFHVARIAHLLDGGKRQPKPAPASG